MRHGSKTLSANLAVRAHGTGPSEPRIRFRTAVILGWRRGRIHLPHLQTPIVLPHKVRPRLGAFAVVGGLSQALRAESAGLVASPRSGVCAARFTLSTSPTARVKSVPGPAARHKHRAAVLKALAPRPLCVPGWPSPEVTRSTPHAGPWAPRQTQEYAR